MAKMDFSGGNSKKMIKSVMGQVSDMNAGTGKMDVSLDLIDINPDNESVFGHEDIDSLAKTIEKDGFIGAIDVYALPNGRYEIGAGHRRYLAMKKLGRKTIPCIVMENADTETKIKHLIKSNIMTRKMTPMMWARSLDYYKKKVIPQGTKNVRGVLAEEFRIAESSVVKYLSFLNLIPEFQSALEDEKINMAFVGSVTSLSAEEQTRLYEKLMKHSDGEFSTISKVVVDSYADQIKREKKLDSLPSLDEVNESAEEAGRVISGTIVTDGDDEESDDAVVRGNIVSDEEAGTYDDIDGRVMQEKEIEDRGHEAVNDKDAYTARVAMAVANVKVALVDKKKLDRNEKQKFIKILKEIIAELESDD